MFLATLGEVRVGGDAGGADAGGADAGGAIAGGANADQFAADISGTEHGTRNLKPFASGTDTRERTITKGHLSHLKYSSPICCELGLCAASNISGTKHGTQNLKSSAESPLQAL